MNLVLDEAEEVSGEPPAARWCVGDGWSGRRCRSGCRAVPLPHHPPPLPSALCPAVKRKTRKALGRILLKGDTITLMQAAK
jgi:small nuclear ribonucleoprotein (snRNP)-like protein